MKNNLIDDDKKKILLFVVQIGRMKLAQQVITQRTKRFLSQKDLALKSKLSLKTIQSIENANCNPYLNTLEKLSKGLEMNFSDFIDF